MQLWQGQSVRHPKQLAATVLANSRPHVAEAAHNGADKCFEWHGHGRRHQRLACISITVNHTRCVAGNGTEDTTAASAGVLQEAGRQWGRRRKTEHVVADADTARTAVPRLQRRSSPIEEELIAVPTNDRVRTLPLDDP